VKISVSFFRGAGGEISPNFDLKNLISTYSKDFPWKKMAQIRQISISKLPRFL
jgi:hypothetical protein